MSSLTYAQAADEMNSLINVAWSPRKIYFDNVRDSRLTNSDPWAVVSIRHSSGRQSSLSGAFGTQEYTRSGVLITQIFSPVARGLQESYDLAKVVSDALEGQSSLGNVWFRNVRITEMGPDGKFYQMNVVADFEYYEIK